MFYNCSWQSSNPEASENYTAPDAAKRWASEGQTKNSIDSLFDLR